MSIDVDKEELFKLAEKMYNLILLLDSEIEVQHIPMKIWKKIGKIEDEFEKLTGINNRGDD